SLVYWMPTTIAQRLPFDMEVTGFGIRSDRVDSADPGDFAACNVEATTEGLDCSAAGGLAGGPSRRPAAPCPRVITGADSPIAPVIRVTNRDGRIPMAKPPRHPRCMAEQTHLERQATDCHKAINPRRFRLSSPSARHHEGGPSDRVFEVD